MGEQQFVIHFAAGGEDYRWSKVYNTLDKAVSAAARMLVRGAVAVMVYQRSDKGKWRICDGNGEQKTASTRR